MTNPVVTGVQLLAGKLASPRRSRILEDVGFVVALILGSLYVTMVEILPAVGVKLGASEAHSHGFPWGLFAILALLVAPKTVGRATAGKVWEGLSGKAHGKDNG